MTRTKHTRAAYVSFLAGSIEINGKTVAGVSSSFGRATCACGWDSGPQLSGAAAQAAFEEHVAATRSSR